MRENLFAYTAPGIEMPGYVSINREENGDVSVTVRAEPRVRDGVYVCAHAKDAGPGRCVAGGPTCNNYCNMAPEKGPMQDHPLPCRHVDAGASVTYTIKAADWKGFPKELINA